MRELKRARVFYIDEDTYAGAHNKVAEGLASLDENLTILATDVKEFTWNDETIYIGVIVAE